MAKASKKKTEEKNKGKVGAPEGNQNALIWDEATTIAKLAEIEEEAKKGTVYYIGQALANVKMYAQWYSEMAEKHKESIIVSETIKRIDQLFEAKLVGKTLGGELNPTMAIFTLKNKHNWKDKTESENKNTNTNLNSEPLTPEKIKEINKALEDEY